MRHLTAYDAISDQLGRSEEQLSKAKGVAIEQYLDGKCDAYRNALAILRSVELQEQEK